MSERAEATTTGGWTRAQVLRGTLGGGAVVAAAAAGELIGAGSGMNASAVGPSNATDEEILNLFLLLEYVQEGFYGEALRTRRLRGELRGFAQTVAGQERGHVAFLARLLGARARGRPRSRFDEAVSTQDRFRSAAIDLEEATIATYIGQAPHLTKQTIGAVAPMVSVEARQAAWLRDIAGQDPAPRAADPARAPDEVVAELRRRGFLS